MSLALRQRQPPRLSIIVVSYNTRMLTLECIASIYRETKTLAFELLVVDNASSDDSAEAICTTFPPSEYPSLRLIALEENIGFAAANNYAAAAADGEYLLLVNPDTVVLDRALERLVAYAEANPESGIYGGTTFFSDGTRNPTAGWMKPSLWSVFCIAIGFARLFPRSRLLNGESLAGRDWHRTMRVDIVTGCLLLIRALDWRRLNGFDPSFFMYGEDADLCFRAVALGMRPVLVPSVQIIHYGGASESVRSDKMVRLFRAKVQLFHYHYRPKTATLFVRIMLSGCILRIGIFSILDILFGARFYERQTEWCRIWNRRREWDTMDSLPLASSLPPTSLRLPLNK